MQHYFKQLGQTILERWQDRNFSLASFPELARVALDEQPPSVHVGALNLVRDFLLNDLQPFQTQSGFGQPELVVYDSQRFYIQVLFWLDGTTDIHQHMFSGAFHVMEGSSLHASFEFCDAESITPHLKVGTLKRIQTQLLETGSTVEIVSGQHFIHSLFHIESPSITVVVRTHSDPGSAPQFTYLPPHLAVDPLHNDTLTNRRKQLLDLLEYTNDSSYSEVVGEMLQKLDFERGFFILQNCVTHLHEIGSWGDVWSVFVQKHGRLASYVAPTIEDILRRDALVGLRSGITDPDQRFFLALLLNVPNRLEILKMVGQRFEGDPEECLQRWMKAVMDAHEDASWVLKTFYGDLLADS